MRGFWMMIGCAAAIMIAVIGTIAAAHEAAPTNSQSAQDCDWMVTLASRGGPSDVRDDLRRSPPPMHGVGEGKTDLV